MAEPLRKDIGKFNCQYDVSGTYVFGQSNAINKAIPQLDTLLFNNNKKTGKILNQLGEPVVFDIQFNEDISQFAFLGDIIGLDSKSGRYRVLLSSKANSNTVLVTERCNNLCKFCSQPPKKKDDHYHYTNAAFSILNFNSSDFIGITGGEPTIYRDHFLKLLKTLKDFKCPSKLHILTNGRSFYENGFLDEVMSVLPDTDIIWGIPIYGHISSLHDTLVKADHAFIETILGISNLLSCGQNIEIRIVPVSENYKYLEHIIQFLIAHFKFLGCISIMNMEPMGYARSNFKKLFVPVKEQNPYLIKAVKTGVQAGLDMQLFNYPLCLIDEGIRGYAKKSISDWKNYFTNECNSCILKKGCCGFFTSSKNQYIERIRPIYA